MAAADATRSARCRKVRQLLFPARLQRSHQALLTPGDWAGKAGLLRQMTDWLTSSRLHVLSRSADPLTTRPSSHLEALSWEICPAYLSSTLTPITSPAAAHSYAVSSLVYRTVRPRADWCGDGGKGCHVARSGHIDQPPSEQGPRRVRKLSGGSTWLTSRRDVKHHLRTTRNADHDAHPPRCEEWGNGHQRVIIIWHLPAHPRRTPV